MIIGLTGTKASGKGVIAEILQGQNFVYSSTSDRVREEALERGLQNYKTSDLQDIGNELRQNHGSAVLIQRTLEKLGDSKLMVIDGIRNLGEVDFLHSKRGILVGVDAPQQIRYERLLQRARHSDPTNWEGFVEMEERDLGRGEDGTGQQTAKCIVQADYISFNHFGTKEELERFLLESKNSLAGLLNGRRPSFNEVYMRQAHEWALRSTCLRRKVGAIITDQDDIFISQGYNGSARGTPHCIDTGCERERLNIPSGQRSEICRAVHAEQNAILNAGRTGRSVVDGILYCTTMPCTHCAKSIANSGIAEVKIMQDYPDELAKNILKEAKVKITHYSGVTPKGFPKFWS